MRFPFRFTFAIIGSFLIVLASAAQTRATFEVRDGDFHLDGQPVTLISGEMHYPRIPREYWRHRMQMLKAMGLNTVATYVFWNLHEPQPGVWDFEGDKDLAQYIRIAAEEGLMVILRPGPYVCAEWEFGGYPWWLQTLEGMEIRRDNPVFLDRTRKYLNRLAQEVAPLQITRGGPIIMVQAENEFGSYVSQRPDIPVEEHRAYNAAIVSQLAEAGFEVPLFTSDGAWLFAGGAVAGALPTANGEENVERLVNTVNDHHDGLGPYMVAEFYTGWLAHWREPLPERPARTLAAKTEEFLGSGVSFNFYMVHGGTNFGFTSGANYSARSDIEPDLTSYDYDAPLSEAGWDTPKYHLLREVIGNYTELPLRPVPDRMPVIEIPRIELTEVTDLLGILASRRPDDIAPRPLTFEEMGQGYGYVLYTKHFNQPISGTLSIEGLRDYAVVYVDGKKAGVLDRSVNVYDMPVEIPFNATLEILVENMGRINYGERITGNNKGITGAVTIDGVGIDGDWRMYGLPMTSVDIDKMAGQTLNSSRTHNRLSGRPLIYSGTFVVEATGDTFVDMSGWGKGIVFVNGRNLGRYWNVGPQQSLYLPGVWLREGENRIIIFEQLNDEPKYEIGCRSEPVYLE